MTEVAPKGWSRKRYSDLLSEVEDRARERIHLPVLSVTKSRGPMLASERFGKVMHGRDLSRYRVASRGHIVADPMLLWDGSIGMQCVVDEGLVSPDYRVYEPGHDTDSDFMATLVRSPIVRSFYQGGAKGTNVRRNRISRADFLAIPVSVPPLPEQRKIAAILSSVDEAIEATQAVIEQTQVVKKAMMAELLTRGIPGRHTKFKMTEIGEVPEEWDVGRIGDFCSLTSGGTPSRNVPDYWNGSVPWVKTGEVNYDLIMSTSETISEDGLKNSAAKVVPKGTVVMAMYGQGATRGRVALLGIEASLNQACLALVSDGRIQNRFLYQCLSANYTKLRALGHEGTQKNLNAGLVREIVIAVPSHEEQEQMLEALESIESRTKRESQWLQQLSVSKAALMSVLLSGEVRVKIDEDAA